MKTLIIILLALLLAVACDDKPINTKQWGTPSADIGFSVAVDTSGNIYVTGYTYGAIDGNTNAGDRDIFLTKWNADGTKAWTKQWGTSREDWGRSVAVDTSGNIYVSGYTEGALDGNTNACTSSCDTSPNSYADIYLTKWNSDGVKQWTKQWGTSEYDYGYSVAVDTTGNIYVTGYTEGALDDNTYAGADDIFLTKWNSSGEKQWTKQWGTSEYDYGYSVAVDTSGSIYVTGYTEGALDDNTYAGADDIFLTKWNSSEEKQWTKQWGTANTDLGRSVAVDTNGNIYVTGYIWGALDGNTSAGIADIYLSKWNSSGVKQWTKQWGTSGRDEGHSVAVDPFGNIYVTGYTPGALDGNTSAGGDCDPDKVGVQPCFDIFLTKWNSSGEKQWTKQWGTSSADGGSSVAVDTSGNIYVTGFTGGTLDGNTSAGGYDIFLSIINEK